MKPLLLFLLLIAIDLESQPLEWSESGTLRVSNTEWQTLYMNSKWRPHPQSRDLAVQDHSKNRWSGFFRASDQTPLFSYQQTVQGSSDQFQLKASVRAEPNLATNLLSYQGTLPIAYYGGTELLLDSTPLKLPSTFDGDPRITIQQVRKVQIPTPEGTLTLEGNSTLMVVDSRKYGGSEFFLRFFYHPHKGSIHESHFSTKIQFTTHDFTPLSLDSVANRDFADPIAGDGKGGWTDQGPENDLSSFDANSKILGDIPFTVGDRTLILSQKTERSDKAFAELEVSANSPAQYLYLLHASAYTWGKVGQIKVLYRDGSEEQFPLNASMDIGNWWNPTPFENAALGWTGSTSEANVGLYISRFRVQEKPIHSITFSATGEPTWMIVAATLSPTELPLPEPEYFEVQANENWQPIPIPRTVKPGSALDFSSWTQAPAGQHGPVITTKDGHFAFSNDTEQNVRFWGTNLNFDANFLPRSQADALALRFRQIGYNAVRIHHYDVLLANGWNPASYGIDPDRLDQLDYLFYAMKEQGLYISTDLFTIRRIRNPELKDLVGNNHAAFKALVPILPAAMEDWKRFARDLLTHTNPYTGMTWAEDPALFSIAPVNEDTLWAAINSSPAIRRLYEERFEEWLQTPSHRNRTRTSRRLQRIYRRPPYPGRPGAAPLLA